MYKGTLRYNVIMLQPPTIWAPRPHGSKHMLNQHYTMYLITHGAIDLRNRRTFFRRFLPASTTRGSPEPLGSMELCQLSANARSRTRRSHQAVAHKRQTSASDSAPSAARRTARCKAVELQHRGQLRSQAIEANCAALDRGQLFFVTNLLTSLASLPMLRHDASSMSTIESESTSCWILCPCLTASTWFLLTDGADCACCFSTWCA